MILHLRDYPPHLDTRLALPDAGLVVVQGPNQSGKSSLVECYAAAMWARTVRGASPWQRETTELRVELPGLRVRRTKHERSLVHFSCIAFAPLQPSYPCCRRSP